MRRGDRGACPSPSRSRRRCTRGCGRPRVLPIRPSYAVSRRHAGSRGGRSWGLGEASGRHRGSELPCRQLLAGPGVFAQVTGQAGDVLGDEPADGAAGVHADDDPAAGVEHETGGLQVGRVGVGECAGRVRDGGGVGAVTDREPQAVPGDQVQCGGLVVYRQGGDGDVRVGEAVQRPLERAELGVAVGAPRSAVVQDDAEAAGQGVRQAKGTAAGKGDGERWERVPGLEHCHLGHAPLVSAAFTGLTVPGRPGSPGHAAAAGGSAAQGDLASGQAARILRSMAMMPVNRMVDETPVTATGLDPESAWWLRVLAETGPRREAALARLHELLVRVARAEVRRRGPRVRIAGPELDDLACQAAADALMAITRKLGQFRGESRFTTWAYKFVIFEVSGKIGQHFWRNPGVPLDAEDWDRLPDRFGFDPAREAEWRDLLGALYRAVDEVLTARQRVVFVAIVLNEVPLDTLVIELASNRNAIYKTLFDARRKLRSALVANVYIGDDSSRSS